MRGIHLIGSSIASFHVARYFIDREFKVTQQGVQSEKFTDKIYLVRDVKKYTYANVNSDINVEATSVVYLGEDITSDLDNEYERFVNYVDLFKSKKFIFVSTDLVYGEGKKEFKEDSSLKPVTAKGEYYVKMEKYLKKHHDNFVILRAAELCGEAVYGKVYEFCKNCIEGKDFSVADNKRDFLYVFNLAELIQSIIKKKIKNEIINVSNGQPVRYIALGNLIASLLGEIKKNPNDVVVPICKVKIEDSEMNTNNMENVVVDITKLTKKLRYEPTYNNITTILFKKILPFQISNLSDIPEERKVELLNRI